MRALTAAVVLVARIAAADVSSEAKADAKRLCDAAAAEWQQGEYLSTLDLFEKAYAKYPSANIRFNIARVLSDLGRDVEALESFEAFVRTADNAPAEALGVARAKIAVLEKKVGQIALHASEPDTTISIDGKPIDRSALERAVRVAPGVHQIVADRPGYLNFVYSVSVMPGQRRDVFVVLHKISAEKPLRKKWWFWTALVGATAVAATTVGLAVKYGTPSPASPEWGSAAPPTSNGLTTK